MEGKEEDWREHKWTVSEGGKHLISQAFPRTVTSLCGKEEEKEEERGGKWAGGCLMGITNTRHTMTHFHQCVFLARTLVGLVGCCSIRRVSSVFGLLRWYSKVYRC